MLVVTLLPCHTAARTSPVFTEIIFIFASPFRRVRVSLDPQIHSALDKAPTHKIRAIIGIARPECTFLYLIELPSNREICEICEKLRPVMAKPILLSVDDDSDVLRAIER